MKNTETKATLRRSIYCLTGESSFNTFKMYIYAVSQINAVENTLDLVSVNGLTLGNSHGVLV